MADDMSEESDGDEDSDADHLRVPIFSFVNGTFRGDLPPELQNLLPAEIYMISQVNVIENVIVREGYARSRARIFSVLNDVARYAKSLPTAPPGQKFLHLRGKDNDESWFRYRPIVVKEALVWLKKHNFLYKDIDLTFPD